MTCADHLRLDNTLADIKEITTVTQSWAHGFDTVAVNLTCCENKPRYAYFTMKLDGGWDKGFEKAIESFTDELRSQINGWSTETLNKIINCRTEYQDIDQIHDCEPENYVFGSVEQYFEDDEDEEDEEDEDD